MTFSIAPANPPSRCCCASGRASVALAPKARLDAQTRKWIGSPSERNRKTRLVRLIDAGATNANSRRGRVMILTFYGFLVALIVSVMCANLAGLILARGSARSKEIAIRLSVGAGRSG